MILLATLKYGIVFLLMASKPSHSNDLDYSKMEEILISTMKDIRSEVIYLQKDLKQVKILVHALDVKSDLLKDNQNAIESRLEKALSKLEENISKDIIEAAKNTSLDVSLSKELLMKNQDAVQSKSEKDRLKLEENLFKYISEAEKNISLSVSLCKETFNATGTLTNLVLEKIFSQTEDIKEILTKKEKPFGNDTHSNGTSNFGTNKTEKPFGNDTHSNGTSNFGTNKTGKENSCTDIIKNFWSVLNELFHMNTTIYADSDINLKNCFSEMNKNITGIPYYISDAMQGKETTDFCQNFGIKPFIPRTQEEFILYIAAVVIDTYIWYPINDIKDEGHVALNDGTDYENSIFKLEKWNPIYKNTDFNDCVRVNLLGEASWVDCNGFYSKYRIVCIP